MLLFWRTVLWVLLVIAASVIAIVVARSTAHRNRTPPPPFLRTRWLWIGPLLVVGGIVATAYGFGTLFEAGMAGESETPGAVVFVSGLAGTFVGGGLIVGRALGHLRTEGGSDRATGRFVRPLVIAAAAAFLAGHGYLFLYIAGAVRGETAAWLVGMLYAIGIVGPWLLGWFALRAAGRKRVGWVFLFTAPWPVLAVDLLAITFSRLPGTYLALAVTAVFIVRLAWGLASHGGRVQATA